MPSAFLSPGSGAKPGDPTASHVFALPPNELVLWTMLAVAVALAAYWRLSARRRFVGPIRTTLPAGP